MAGLTGAPSRQPLSVRAVERAAALLGRGSSRRRFLTKAALVGSALATDPFGYILRPTTAYASVCGSGNTCGSGWSVFCCTINDGANTCPDYSYVAGWWKVDDSAFCLGAPRYYIDCNRRPRDHCRCRCNSGGCDRRRVCCNVFRYGQCNTHIGGITEVVCRIITCTPPWQWDPACGRTVRTSNATRSHSAACLPGTNPTPIEIKYQDLGLTGSVLGEPAGRERAGAGPGRKRRYERGMILWHPDFGAHEVHGRIARRYRDLGADGGDLGYPRTDTRKAAGGTFVRFDGGGIYRHADTGTRVVTGRTERRYHLLDGPEGLLGFPTSHTRPITGGKRTVFQSGAIFQSADTPAVEVTGALLRLLRRRGGPAGSGLGFPVLPRERLNDGTVLQRFTDGAITGPRPREAVAIRGATFARWEAEGAVDSPWGLPTGHTDRVAGTDGERTPFTTVVVYWEDLAGVHWLTDPIEQRYQSEGGPAGALGFPVTDEATDPATGRRQVTFEHGVITYDPATGQTEVVPDGGAG